MSELCIDASVAVKLVLKGEPFRHQARQLLKDCLVNNIALIAPPFFASESDTVIRKRVCDGKLSRTDAQNAFSGLDKVTVQLLMHSKMRQRAREIAEQFNLRAVMTLLMQRWRNYTAVNSGRRARYFMTRSKQRLFL